MDSYWDVVPQPFVKPEVKYASYSGLRFAVIQEFETIIILMPLDGRRSIVVFAVVRSKVVIENNNYIINPSPPDISIGRSPLVPLSCPGKISTSLPWLQVLKESMMRELGEIP